MTQLFLLVLMGLTVGFVLSAQIFIIGVMMAEAQLITVPMPANDTKLILNMKDHTQTLVNVTTNKTISVENFTFYKGNETKNETLGKSLGNMTTNNSLADKF